MPALALRQQETSCLQLVTAKTIQCAGKVVSLLGQQMPHLCSCSSMRAHRSSVVGVSSRSGVPRCLISKGAPVWFSTMNLLLIVTTCSWAHVAAHPSHSHHGCYIAVCSRHVVQLVQQHQGLINSRRARWHVCRVERTLV